MSNERDIIQAWMDNGSPTDMDGVPHFEDRWLRGETGITVRSAPLTVTLYHLIANGYDGSAAVYTFTSADRRSAFRDADDDPQSWMGEGEVVLDVDDRGVVSDHDAGGDRWTEHPSHRKIDRIAEVSDV